jgi:hypothetical protein
MNAATSVWRPQFLNLDKIPWIPAGGLSREGIAVTMSVAVGVVREGPHAWIGSGGI